MARCCIKLLASKQCRFLGVTDACLRGVTAEAWEKTSALRVPYFISVVYQQIMLEQSL